MYDLVIKNAVIFDGKKIIDDTDLAVEGDRIVCIGALDAELSDDSTKIIDAAGQVLSPGFIHMHSHGDCSIAMWPESESSLGQGITTEFTGHCGLGVAPVRNNWLYMFPEKLAFEKVVKPPIGGGNPYGFQMTDLDSFRPVFEETYGERLDWTTYRQWKNHLLKRKIGVNLYSLVGHGQLRTQAMGADYKRHATVEERKMMMNMLDEAMKAGARGLGIGLDYQPGMYADERELLELFSVVKRYNGIVTAHLRMISWPAYNEPQSVVKGMLEFLELTRKAGVRAHISHISAAEHDVDGNEFDSISGAAYVLYLIHEEKEKFGRDITWDVIPRYCYGPFHYAMLGSLFEPYIQNAGGLKEFSYKLNDTEYASVIEQEIESGNHPSKGPFTCINPVKNPAWDENQIITGSKVSGITGLTIKQAALDSGMSSVAFCLDLMKKDPETYILPLHRRPESTPDRDFFVASHGSSIALDCWIMNYDAKLSYDNMPLETGSPDTYCGMFLYIDRQKDLGESMVTILSRITGRPADILGLNDRGYLREGYAADLVLLDWENCRSAIDWTDPRKPPEGIALVVVNGKVAVENGIQQHAGSGTFL